MAAYPRADTNRCCSNCHFYRPQDVDEGNRCLFNPPSAASNLDSETATPDEFPPIVIPTIAWCGDFKPYVGDERS
jgi:hypothetical protein